MIKILVKYALPTWWKMKTVFRQVWFVSFWMVPFLGFSGVLLTKNKQAEIGTLVESTDAVALQSQHGAVDYKKDTLLWYSVDKEIDTLFKAAQKAKADNNLQVAIILLELSLAKEPSTQSEVQKELNILKNTVTGQLTGSLTPDQSQFRTPEEKIARAKQMIENAKTMLSQQHIDPSLEASTNETANQTLAEGNRLLAEGEKELADQKAKQAALEAKSKVSNEPEQIAPPKEISKSEIEWTQEEKIAHLALLSVFGLLVLIALWRMTMVEKKK